MQDVNGVLCTPALMDRRPERNRLDLYPGVVLGANPEHSTGVVSVLHHLGGHHRPSALRALVLIMVPFVSHAGTGRLRKFFCHESSSIVPNNCENKKVYGFRFACQHIVGAGGAGWQAGDPSDHGKRRPLFPWQ
jgi:hypothetical protein